MKKPKLKIFILIILLTIGAFFSIFNHRVFAETTLNPIWIQNSTSCASPFIVVSDSSCPSPKPGGNPRSVLNPATGGYELITDPIVCCGGTITASGATIEQPPPKFKGTLIKPEAKFLAPIPGIEYGSVEKYLGSIYNWGISIVGVLALIQLIRGGLMYMVSGAVEQKSSAKEIITDALIGLIIALASVVIVTVLNPRLTIMTKPVLETPAPETPALEEPPTGESLPPPTGERVAKCLTYAELQNLVDNDYACESVTYFNPCPSDQGGYECLKSTQ